MENTRVIGHVVSVNGFRVNVELSAEAKSSSRATPDGVQRAVAINSFLTFDLGAGTNAIGTLNELDYRESFEPSTNEELALELTKPRRIASVQLLGTVKKMSKGEWKFDTGLTVLPTLDTPAEIANPSILSCIFGRPPMWNKPRDCEDEIFDCPLEMGHHTGDENTKISASFNDLFSRPLAVIGNTGSGKSYTVASLIHGIIENEKLQSTKGIDPHIFILDINGEYANAFSNTGQTEYQRSPNKLYMNGKEFCLPAWLMNGEEICDWLQASEATQEPVLKDWWAMAKAKDNNSELYDPLQVAIQKMDIALAWLDENKPKSTFEMALEHASQYAPTKPWNLIKALPIWTSPTSASLRDKEWVKIDNDKEVRDKLTNLRNELQDEISDRQTRDVNFAKSADAPLFVPINKFRDPKLVDRSSDQDGSKKIDQYLLTLKLRLRTKLDDRRWHSFFCFEEQNIGSYQTWMRAIGIGNKSTTRISVFDLSMLSSEILPYACALLGRLFLESREMLKPDVRSRYPWLLVLEEAHNYARPPQTLEERGQSLSRKSFERVAKEGRKFGLSLMVASQRPSEVSPTIMSQCANFFSHRLQNPTDIDHLRKIVPRQAQGLLDQVTVLAAGEAIVFGSAVHVSARVQIKMPKQEPWSETAAPFIDWQKSNSFPLDDVSKDWGLNDSQADIDAQFQSSNENKKSTETDYLEADLDEDIPF